MAEITVKLKPLQTPNFVIAEMPARPREEGFHTAPTWPLKDVDETTLARMCDEFRAEIFRKAGKKDPAKGEKWTWNT